MRAVLRGIATAAALLIGFSALVAGAFFLTDAVYRATGVAPADVLAQVINALLGLVLSLAVVVGLIALAIARSRSQRGHMGIFEPIFAAMEQIAGGDFHVRLRHPYSSNIIASQLAKSVNQMAEELDQMEHMRQEFISNVSHEIQSPLTSIRGFAQALRVEHLSAEAQQHFLSIIETESMRLSRMTDNMLRLVSLDSEHMQLAPRPFRLDKQIRTLIVAYEPQWTSKALDMAVALDEIVVTGDEDLIGQVWGNLLHNSIKFTPSGGRILVEVRRQGDCIACRFTDTGIGIPADVQRRVFERFFKADSARERAPEGSGSGLGLAIAKRIVELHRGTIGVSSQPGAGTTFTVLLPVE